MSSKALSCTPVLGQNEIPMETGTELQPLDPMDVVEEGGNNAADAPSAGDSTLSPPAVLLQRQSSQPLQPQSQSQSPSQQPQQQQQQQQPAQSPTTSPRGSGASTFTMMSPSWGVAVFNKSKLRAFFHSHHFSTLKQVEASLYAASIFVICDAQGLIERISATKYRGHLGEHIQVRVDVLGPWEFFVSTYAPRHFYFEFHQPSLHSWNPVQMNALLLTQRLLNQKAQWYAEGNERRSVAASGEGPPPYIPMIPRSATGGASLASPPGHDDDASAGQRRIYQPTFQQETPEVLAERTAMSNLKKLGTAAGGGERRTTNEWIVSWRGGRMADRCLVGGWMGCR